MSSLKPSQLSLFDFFVRRLHVTEMHASERLHASPRDAHSLLLVTHGSAAVTTDSTLTLDAGSVLLLSSGTPCSVACASDAALLLVTAQLCDTEGAPLILSDAPVTLAADEALMDALTRLLHLYRHSADRAALSQAAMEAFHALSRLCAARELGSILPVVEYVHAHLDADLRVDALAALSGMCESSLRREFSTRLGMSPKAYILERKLVRACEMLASGLYSIKEICELLGFWDDAYFSKLFKRHTGLTPMQYAKEHGGV